MKTLDIIFNKKEFNKTLETMPMKRFKSIKDIESYLHKITGIKLHLEEKSRDEFEQEYDFCLISNVTINNADLCYLDIYYLKDNSGQYYITEVSTDFNT